MRQKRDLIFCICAMWCFGLLAFVMGYWPNVNILALYTVCLTGAFVLSPAVGLAGFIMIIPFEDHFTATLTFSAFFSLIPSMILGYAVHCIWKRRSVPFGKEGLLLGIGLVIAALLSFVSSDLTPQFRVFASLVLMIMTFLCAESIVRHDHDSIFLIGHGFVAASVVGGISGLVYLGGSQYEIIQEIGTGGRLSIGGNVRLVGTIIGLALFILIGSALLRRFDIVEHERGQKIFPFERNMILRSAFIILLGSFIAASALRGVIIAVVVGIVGLMIISVVLGGVRGARLRLSYWAFPVLALSTYAIIVITMTYVDPEILGGRLTMRLEEFLREPLSNPRIWIWSGTLAQLTGVEWLFGTGIGTFRVIAAQGGVYYYAHSIFVNILVEMGVFGLAILLAFCAFLVKATVKTKNVFGLALLIFLVVSFSTYGSISNKAFWITLGMIYGMSRSGYLATRIRRRVVPTQWKAQQRKENVSTEVKGM